MGFVRPPIVNRSAKRRWLCWIGLHWRIAHPGGVSVCYRCGKSRFL